MILRRRPPALLLGLLLLTVLAGCGKVPGIYVYEKAGTPQGGAAAFDPTTYVEGIWASKIVPTVHDQATDVTTVAAAIAKDPNAAGEQYGKRSGTGSPYAFLVKGEGTVAKIDTDAPTGPLTVEVPADAGGKAVTVSIATGPVIPGTALRDGVGFISFGDFTNQIDYANAATQINARVKTDVIAKADVKNLVGKKITFYGAFSALAPGSIFVIPTELQAAG